MKTIPAFFFPTQTIVIDDNIQFLESLSLGLSCQTHSYKFFSNPIEALSFIKENAKRSNWIKKYIELLEEEEAHHKIIDVNISELYKEMFNKERFKVITNIVVDFDMPVINGLDFCESIIEIKDINKILLTGTVDDKSAIDAFNKKLINYFIPKNSSKILASINEATKDGSSLYFDNLSEIIYTSIKTNKCSVVFENK